MDGLSRNRILFSEGGAAALQHRVDYQLGKLLALTGEASSASKIPSLTKPTTGGCGLHRSSEWCPLYYKQAHIAELN